MSVCLSICKSFTRNLRGRAAWTKNSDMLEGAYKLELKKVWQNATTVPIEPIQSIHKLQNA